MAQYNLFIQQGDYFAISLTAKDTGGNVLDLTSCSGKAVMKSKYSDTGILGEFDVSIANPTSGVVLISMPSSGTAQLPSSIGVYSLEISSNSEVVTYINGYVSVYPQISTNFP